MVKAVLAGPQWTARHAAMAVLAMACAGPSVAAAAGVALDRPSLTVGTPERVVLLGAALSDGRAVAVGERGIVVTSDDQGEVWHQSPTPTSVTLTAVRFAGSTGFAVGHGGTVLVSRDGGRTWERRLDGVQIAHLELDAARHQGDAGAMKAAQRLVDDGPDKPLLDLLVLDRQRAVAVGAYGLAVSTEDGGQTWSSWRSRLNNPKELHLYGVRRRGDRMLVIGEQGLVLLSTNAGASFTRLSTPYAGSFFTGELPDDRSIVVAGLRGNVLRSTDAGVSWQAIGSPQQASITASTMVAEGRVLFANQAGGLLVLVEDRLKQLSVPVMPPLNFLLPLDSRRVLLLSMKGARPVELPSVEPATTRPAR